jgi:quercetin dioxygenase-like cupin family protein
MGTFKRAIGESLNGGLRSGREELEMSRKRGAALAAAALIAVIVIGASVVPSAAQQPIDVELLTDRTVFTDNVDVRLKNKFDGKKKFDVVNVKKPSPTVTARITLEDGAQFPWHTHRGPVVVNVVEGQLTYVAADDCKRREYPQNTAFIDAGGDHVHTAFATGETVLVATFFRATLSGSLLIPADEPEDCVV